MEQQLKQMKQQEMKQKKQKKQQKQQKVEMERLQHEKEEMERRLQDAIVCFLAFESSSFSIVKKYTKYQTPYLLNRRQTLHQPVVKQSQEPP